MAVARRTGRHSSGGRPLYPASSRYCINLALSLRITCWFAAVRAISPDSVRSKLLARSAMMRPCAVKTISESRSLNPPVMATMKRSCLLAISWTRRLNSDTFYTRAIMFRIGCRLRSGYCPSPIRLPERTGAAVSV